MQCIYCQENCKKNHLDVKWFYVSTIQSKDTLKKIKGSFRNAVDDSSERVYRVSSILTVIVPPESDSIIYRCQAYVIRTTIHFHVYYRNLTLRAGKATENVNTLFDTLINKFHSPIPISKSLQVTLH